MNEPKGLVAPDGRPLRRAAAASKACPRCRADEGKRVPSGGFGDPHPVCGVCGYEWHDERWQP